MILIAILGFLTVGTLLLTAFFSGHLGMMSVTRGGDTLSLRLHCYTKVERVQQSRVGVETAAPLRE